MTTAMTWTSQCPARADSVRHNSKRSVRDSLTGHVSDARRRRSSQRVPGSKRRESKTCVILKSPTNGSTTRTLVREESVLTPHDYQLAENDYRNALCRFYLFFEIN